MNSLAIIKKTVFLVLIKYVSQQFYLLFIYISPPFYKGQILTTNFQMQPQRKCTERQRKFVGIGRMHLAAQIDK